MLAIILRIALLLAGAAETAEQLYQSGVELFEQGKPEAALAALEKAVRAQPGHAAAWKAIGVVYAAQGDAFLAEPAFRKACQFAPALADACFYHGRALHLLNRFEEAIGVLNRIAKQDPRAHRVIGLSLEGLGRWAEAEAAFGLAIRLYRGGEDPRIDYAVSLIRQGRPQDSLAPLEAALRDAPTSSRAHFELGRALVQLERIEAALPHLERAVALDSRSASARLLLGKLYLRLGRPDQAGLHLREGAREAK